MAPVTVPEGGVPDRSGFVGSVAVESEAGHVAAMPGAADPVARLERLTALHAEGALTDEQFEVAKKQVLGTS